MLMENNTTTKRSTVNSILNILSSERLQFLRSVPDDQILYPSQKHRHAAEKKKKNICDAYTQLTEQTESS